MSDLGYKTPVLRGIRRFPDSKSEGASSAV